MNFRISILLFLFALPIALFAQSAATSTGTKAPVKKHTTKKRHRSTTKPAPVVEPIYTDNVIAKSPKQVAANQAIINFAETAHHFGEIKQGDIVKHDFEFTNTGTSELLILEADATCGCTQPSYPFIPIAPGEKGRIGITFNSAGKMGVQRPTVTVTTNGVPKIIKVNLEGVVK